MTPLVLPILTHGVAVFAGVIIGLVIAHRAITPNKNPDRFWNGR